MTITPEHRKRLRDLHARDPNFGVIGHLWAPRVEAFIRELGCRSYLDYGSGRSGLSVRVREDLDALGYPIENREYDPAFHMRLPEPADFVSCIDVLEHVERLMLESVFLDLKRVTRKALFLTVSLRNAKNRNLHPNVLRRATWIQKAEMYIGPVSEVPILDPTKASSEVAMFVRPR